MPWHRIGIKLVQQNPNDSLLASIQQKEVNYSLLQPHSSYFRSQRLCLCLDNISDLSMDSA